MAKKTLHCVQCGRELAGRQTKFCSNKCKKAWQAKQARIGASKAESFEVRVETLNPVDVEYVSVAKAAGTGDKHAALVALRQKLAVEIDLADSPRDVATLSARFMEALDKLQELEDSLKKPKGGALDEFTKRREARRASGS